MVGSDGFANQVSGYQSALTLQVKNCPAPRKGLIIFEMSARNRDHPVGVHGFRFNIAGEFLYARILASTNLS